MSDEELAYSIARRAIALVTDAMPGAEDAIATEILIAFNSDRATIARLTRERDEARAELDREATETADHFGRMSVLWRAIADALKGPPPKNVSHSWHDLPEIAARLRADNERLREAITRVSDDILGVQRVADPVEQLDRVKRRHHALRNELANDNARLRIELSRALAKLRNNFTDDDRNHQTCYCTRCILRRALEGGE